MSKPKPGELLTYTADIERTGVVLDARPDIQGVGSLGAAVWPNPGHRSGFRVLGPPRRWHLR